MISFELVFDEITHLDAGNDAELLDEVDEGFAGVGLLEDGLVEEDDAGDALQLRLGHREEELSVGAGIDSHMDLEKIGKLKFHV